MTDRIFSRPKPPGSKSEPQLPRFEREVKKEAPEGLPQYTVELPSKGKFYGGTKAISVTPLTILQVRQLYGLRQLKSEYNRKSGFASVLSRSVHNFDLFRLTKPDFDFLLYWIRLNTFKSSPYVVTWSYTPPGWSHEKSMVTQVQMANFDIIEIKDHLVPAYDTERVEDWLARLLLEEKANSEDEYSEDERADFSSRAWIAPYAACLKMRGNLEDKIAKFDSMDAGDLIGKIMEHQRETHHEIVPYILLSDPEYPDVEPFRKELLMELDDFFPS